MERYWVHYTPSILLNLLLRVGRRRGMGPEWQGAHKNLMGVRVLLELNNNTFNYR